jgi:hypothetical protein
MTKGHKQGGKMTGKHTTIIPAAENIIDLLQKNVFVDKISAGFIKHGIKSGKHSIKIMDMDSGLLLKIRGTASIQEIRVYTNYPDEVQKVLIIYATDNNYQCNLK